MALRRRTLVGVNNYPNLAEKVPEFEAPPENRLAAPFEKIRARTAEIAAGMGRYPKVLLLPAAMSKCAGRAPISASISSAARVSTSRNRTNCGLDADLIVLCSSDPEYLALAAGSLPAVQVPVMVAGNPKDQIEALKAAGVQGFVHVCRAMPSRHARPNWQERIAERSRQ